MMSKSLSSLLFFFLWLALLSIKLRSMTSHATAAMIRYHNAERQALLELKRRLDDPSNRLTSWVGKDCCAWKGIGCSNVTGHVIKLNLQNEHVFYDDWDKFTLRGDISTASSLQYLQELTHLDLSGNDFSGHTIPTFFGSFARLTYFDLSEASFTGKVPDQLGNLSNLRHLDLNGNTFTGPIPAFLGSFARLTYLDLSEASFTGKVPDQLGNLSTLRYLDLSYNSYEGNDYYGDSNRYLYIENPGWIARLTSLRLLNMSDVSFRSASNWFEALNALPHIEDVELAGCDIKGPLPHSLHHLNFTSLRTLNLEGNNISGTEPVWLYNITTLKSLNFFWNDIYWSSMHGSITRLASLKELYLSGNISKSFLLLLANLCKLQSLGLAKITIKDKPSNLEMLFSGCLMHSLEELYLYNNQLNGSLPNWLGNLKNIKHIDLYNSSLHDSILNSLGSLTSLQYLDLRYNNLNGTIGDNVGQLKNLIHVDLSHNLLHGSFPVSFGSLTSLQYLDLHSNNLNETVGENIGSLTSLQYLDLHSNNLNEAVGESIGQLKNLIYLDLSNNSLSLSPIHLANLSSLKYLIISNNIVFMEESDDWITTFQLVLLDMDSCKIVPRPDFPKWLQTQTMLSSLYLSNVGIEGTIPDWLPSSLRYLSLSNNRIHGNLMHFFPNLKGLYLSNNSFSGCLRLQMTNMMSSLKSLDLSNNHFIGKLSLNFTKLQFLDLSNNMFSGHLNPTINNTLLNLQYLDLSMNNFSGRIPHSLCQMNLLIRLHISNNSFSGQLPNCWNSSFNMDSLDFSNNQISGEIPNTLCNLKGIKFLHLGYNHLSGRIPLCLHDCKYLTTLDAGHNYLIGNIPSWSNKSFPYLKVLNLRSNSLSGIIPELSKLTRLQTLDLSNNKLSGSIPHTFGNFTSMRNSENYCNIPNRVFNFDILWLSIKGKEYDILWLFIKGKEYKYITLDSLAKSIDLSNNHLSGYIPEEMGNLFGLQNLNLSRNNLTGEIPRSMGGMQNLEVLDLSRNNLSGAIPSSLRDLTFLGILNLSYNNLSGSIPIGGQLQTFEASTYIGNRYLCGFPLSKNCTNDKEKSNAEEENKDRDGRREIIWLWSSITLGFIMGFWGIWGTLLLHKRWRIFYFRTIDNTYDKLCMEMLVKMRRKSFIED